jgi:hypothetical protein
VIVANTAGWSGLLLSQRSLFCRSRNRQRDRRMFHVVAADRELGEECARAGRRERYPHVLGSTGRKGKRSRAERRKRRDGRSVDATCEHAIATVGDFHVCAGLIVDPGN